ncbi:MULTISPECIES: M28 family metallopeptidase [Alteromonas]|jgi:Peptidase family M28|uniref:M28 family metallopeptidase n=1 Tax=Alteromonas TaxID=226 RepID=UPI000C6C26A8|nr:MULTISPECIES: M28 family peptidase [Alteromonas]MAB92301.1 Zn-dependent exopeptidase M28 [Alteromonas sp.]QPL49593.1 M28 family peptidase [Alteromonas sp. B31-7]HAI71407.1 Zn-dependent exopeptidase M28 [Alteromonas australica]|tara:strand:- start:1215 stop:2264 length:1050 start_codon:yes stop_codon:yes gene_type:complete
MKKAYLFAVTFIFSCLTASASQSDWDSLVHFSSTYGERLAGKPGEQKAAQWLTAQFEAQDVPVNIQPFTFFHYGKNLPSQNIEVVIEGQSDKTLIIGAHYDAIGYKKGSHGLTDNASGAITLLALAKQLQGKTPYYNVRIVLFGAEEVGLFGARHYVSSLIESQEIAHTDIVGMINLDTVIGGDMLYVHSAHALPYKCADSQANNFNSNPVLRDALLTTSTTVSNTLEYLVHPTTEDYPEGVTGGWSDHAPFACAGFPIAYIEATNFAIDGESGRDGYSQTANSEFWTCFDDKTLSACNREEEKFWGKLWHTKFDQQAYLIPTHEKHMKAQFHSNVALLKAFVLLEPNG